MELLSGVGKTVEEYTDDSVSDIRRARGWPSAIRSTSRSVATGRRLPRRTAPKRVRRTSPATSGSAAASTGRTRAQIEGILVPAARRKLAQSRLTVLSTLVLMGINRIVVTGGKLRATMGFHINTRDTAHAESASQLDTRRRRLRELRVRPLRGSGVGLRRVRQLEQGRLERRDQHPDGPHGRGRAPLPERLLPHRAVCDRRAASTGSAPTPRFPRPTSRGAKRAADGRAARPAADALPNAVRHAPSVAGHAADRTADPGSAAAATADADPAGARPDTPGTASRRTASRRTASRRTASRRTASRRTASRGTAGADADSSTPGATAARTSTAGTATAGTATAGTGTATTGTGTATAGTGTATAGTGTATAGATTAAAGPAAAATDWPAGRRDVVNERWARP